MALSAHMGCVFNTCCRLQAVHMLLSSTSMDSVDSMAIVGKPLLGLFGIVSQEEVKIRYTYSKCRVGKV